MKQILQKINTKPLSRAYVVFGPETKRQEEVFNALKNRALQDGFDDWNWSLFFGAKDLDVSKIVEELSQVPWGGGTKIVVIKDAGLILASELERIAVWLKEHENANCLALFFDKLDSRLKYVKILRGFAEQIECTPLQGESLVRYATDYCHENGKTMKRKAVDLFLERVGSDLMFVHSELDKLLAYVGEENEITTADVQAVTSLVPGQTEHNTVFALTDHIAAGERSKALQLLNALVEAGETPFRILPLIERQLRLILAAKTRTASVDDTAKQMGERSSFALKKMLPLVDKFSLDRIYAGFAAVVHCDREMKLGVDGQKALEELITRLTTPK